MKKQVIKPPKPSVHIVHEGLLNPTNPIIVNLIGAGGTGSQVLTALARINYALVSMGHPGLFVRVFDDDTVSQANLGRQLFASAEVGLYKANALVNRINRFFGTDWKAICERYGNSFGEREWKAAITLSCVDTVAARFDIAGALKQQAKKTNHHYRNSPIYWIDFGNSRDSGQVILATVADIRQPASKKYKTVSSLPFVTDEYANLLTVSEATDDTPSCSLAEALGKQDLFVNSCLANLGASLLWQMFKEGMLFNRGFFMNLKDFRTQPLKVA